MMIPHTHECVRYLGTYEQELQQLHNIIIITILIIKFRLKKYLSLRLSSFSIILFDFSSLRRPRTLLLYLLIYLSVELSVYVFLCLIQSVSLSLRFSQKRSAVRAEAVFNLTFTIGTMQYYIIMPNQCYYKKNLMLDFYCYDTFLL